MFHKPGFLILITVTTLLGCSTYQTSDTARTALEQLLISNAVDQSLNAVDFSALRDSRVYLEEKYLDGVDKNYVIATVRHRILNEGVGLVSKSEDSDITIEIRSGAIGTDKRETFVGIPQLSIPLPLPVQIPEVPLFTTTTQFGTAKIGLVAYETNSRQVVHGGGTSLGRSIDNNMYVFGMGPINRGSIRDELTNQKSGTATSDTSELNFAGWPKRKNGPVQASFDEPAPTGDQQLP